MKVKFSTVISAVLVSILLTSVFFVTNSTSEFPQDPQGAYSPWADLNDDGTIDIFDLVWMAVRYGTTGTPVNKTELLYNVSDTLDSLWSRIDNLESRIRVLEAFKVVSTYSATKASTTETLNWVDLNSTSLSIRLTEPSLLVILFSTEAMVVSGFGNIRVRALINGTVANPGDVYLNPYLTAEGALPVHRHTLVNGTYSYNFFGQAEAGVNTIQVQWRLLVAQGPMQANVWDRTLTVIAFPLQ